MGTRKALSTGPRNLVRGTLESIREAGLGRHRGQYAMLVAIEGIDGSGKGTQAQALVNRAEAEGMRAALMSYPQYGDNPFSQAIADYLNGKLGSLEQIHPKLAALLFAGDRFASRVKLEGLLAKNDLVVCDRYVWSNVAYQAAKLPENEWQAFAEWVSEVEFEYFWLPRPEQTVWLDVPVEVARRLIAMKSKSASRNEGNLFSQVLGYTGKKADLHEENAAYLARCREVYSRMATWSGFGSWIRIEALDNSGSLMSAEQISHSVWQAVQGAIRPARANLQGDNAHLP